MLADYSITRPNIRVFCLKGNNVHDTDEENDADSQLLLPRQTKRPDDLLRKKQRDDIEDQVGNGRRKTKLRDGEAAEGVGQQRVPVPLKWRAVGKTHDEENDGEGGNDTARDPAGPGKVASLLIRDEDLGPLQQDGDLDEGDEDDVEQCGNPAHVGEFSDVFQRDVVHVDHVAGAPAQPVAVVDVYPEYRLQYSYIVSIMLE